MNNSVLVDNRMKSKIEELYEFNNNACMVKFKDLDDSFFFNDKYELQEFLNEQTVERFYDKELRNGYFDYKNENNNIIRYYIEVNRGNLELINEEVII